MNSQILAGLGALNWQIFNYGTYYYALHPERHMGLIFYDLDLFDPQKLNFDALYPEADNYQVIVFSPHGLDSSYLKNISQHPKVQYWFWDNYQGNVFPSPPAKDRRLILWLSQLANGHIVPFEQSAMQKVFTPNVTYGIIGINILLFVFMTLAGGSTNTEVLIAFGAKVNELIKEGQVMRLLTSTFLHVGFLHLFFNLYALYSLGTLAERLLGHSKYLILYLLSGIGGSLASFLFSPAISAGASGAIFGLLGALLVFTWKYPRLRSTGLGTNLIIVLGFNLIYGFSQPGIDNYAHLGGLIVGALTCLYFLSNPKAQN